MASAVTTTGAATVMSSQSISARPFTYSIANGIAFGFISWTAIKLLSGRGRELNPALVILSILFVIKLGWFNA